MSFHPAGHVLGSAQILLQWKGLRIAVSGDYKRRRDPTCARFEVVPERTHLVGAYALGKAQRIICLLREAGYHEPLFIHGALKQLCQLYEDHGVDLGSLENATIEDGSKQKNDFAGKIVIGPPSSFATSWARRFADPVTAFASGWMQINGYKARPLSLVGYEDEDD